MPELFSQALNLAMYGMGTVFAFLTALVFLTTLMSRLVATFSKPELDQGNTASTTAAISPATIAAVAAAVKQHRERN